MWHLFRLFNILWCTAIRSHRKRLHKSREWMWVRRHSFKKWFHVFFPTHFALTPQLTIQCCYCHIRDTFFERETENNSFRVINLNKLGETGNCCSHMLLHDIFTSTLVQIEISTVRHGIKCCFTHPIQFRSTRELTTHKQPVTSEQSSVLWRWAGTGWDNVLLRVWALILFRSAVRCLWKYSGITCDCTTFGFSSVCSNLLWRTNCCLLLNKRLPNSTE